MEKSDIERVYPAAPLEVPIAQQQQQPLLPPAPPTYDQATGTTPTTTTEAPITNQPTTSAPHVVVITQPTTTVPFGPHPIDMQCPFCHNYIRTTIRHKPTSRTHLLALLLCMLQLYCLVCLPYLIGSCMKTNHYCGLCGNYLGTYDRT